MLKSMGQRSTLFQSTLPARGATGRVRIPLWQGEISIHAPRTGSDLACSAGAPLASLFQSTLPARGATAAAALKASFDMAFQSTLPARGATAGDAIHP